MRYRLTVNYITGKDTGSGPVKDLETASGTGDTQRRRRSGDVERSAVSDNYVTDTFGLAVNKFKTRNLY